MSMQSVKTRLVETDDKIIVRLKQKMADEKKIEVKEFILDISEFGEIIGIEMISPKSKYNIRRIVEFEDISSGITLAFDESCDALYLKLSRERSRNQKAVSGYISLNSEGELVAIEVSRI